MAGRGGYAGAAPAAAGNSFGAPPPPAAADAVAAGRTTSSGHSTGVPCVFAADRSYPLVVLLRSAAHVPRMDLTSESDPYVKMRAVKGGKPVAEAPASQRGLAGDAPYLKDQHGPYVKWPVCNDEPNPVWNTPRWLGCNCHDADEIRIELYDYDLGPGDDDFIGRVHVPLSRLRVGVLSEWRLECTKKTSPKHGQRHPTLRLCPLAPTPQEKWVYFVRHGESQWNEAQAKGKVGDMLKRVNHPLNATGRGQAEGLRQKLLQDGDRKTPLEQAMMEAGAVWTSPLTRAAQTAVIALEPLLRRRMLCVRKSARERRNRGGRDTSGSGANAQEWVEGLRRETAALCSAEEAARLVDPRMIDAAEVEAKWWDDSKESVKSFSDRASDLLRQLRFASEHSLVVVGHSHFIRELFRHHVADGVQPTGAPLSALQSQVISNAGVAAMRLDFGKWPRVITSVELLYGTTVKGHDPEDEDDDDDGSPPASPKAGSPKAGSPKAGQ